MNEQELKQAETIRDYYSEKTSTQNKLQELIDLDKKVVVPAKVIAYILGSIFVLILGSGMCICLNVLNIPFALGVVIGVVGIALCVGNYFCYKAILNTRKKKYQNQILNLSNELLKN